MEFRKDIGMTASLGSSLDSLESAFSDSTRKHIRQINVEWQRVLKCRNVLAAKEDELQAAKENKAQLQELKIQSENYLNSAEKRFEELKLSNADLKRKINKLEKEREKTVKNGNEQVVYMRQKIALYEEKWHKMYETPHTTNPKRFEKIRRIKEVRELSEKLQNLIEEEKKYQKELFLIKSKRNIFTSGDKVYPFQNFVVNIAKIYLKTKNIYAECEKVSKEIADTEIRIKSKRQILSHDKMSSLRSFTTVAQNFEQNATKETVVLKQNNGSDVEMHEYENTESALAMNISFESSIDADRDNSIKSVKNFTNDLFSASKNAKQNPLSNEGKEYNIIDAEKNDYAAKTAKVLPEEAKARKWMERLKIFVPKFRITPEENIIKDVKNSTISVLLTNGKTDENSKMNIPTKNLRDTQWNVGIKNTENVGKITSPHKNFNIMEPPQPMTTSVKKVILDDTSFEVPRDLTLHQTSIQNKSKYFRNVDENAELMDWDKELAYAGKDAVKPSIEDNKLEDRKKFERKTREIKNDQQQNAPTFNEPMDIDENRSKVESSVQMIKEAEANEVIEENIKMGSSLWKTNRERETISSLQRNNTSIHSFDLNENEIVGNKQHTNMSHLMLEKINKIERKPTSECKEAPIYSSVLSNKETINKYQNKNLEDSLLQINLERKTRLSSERKEILMSSPAEKSDMNQYQKKSTSSAEIQRELHVQHQIEKNKMPNDVITDSVCDNVMIATSKQHESHYILDNNTAQMPDVSKSEKGKFLEIISPKKMNIRAETPQSNRKIGLQVALNVSNETSESVPASRFSHSLPEPSVSIKSPQNASVNKISYSPAEPYSDNNRSVPTNRISHSPVRPSTSKKSFQSVPTNRISHSPVDSSSKISQPDSKIPSGSIPKSPSLNGSNPKTPLTKHLEISQEPHTDMDNSNISSFKADSPSPGFAFTTRLMHPADAASSKDPSENRPKDAQSSIFAQMPFLNATSPQNFVFGDTQSPDDESNRFLADYENYLTDSPPVIKGTEKSMFAFAEDSPENENKDDFFPLFASSDRDAERDTGNHGTAFTFNFGGNSQVESESPEGNKGFKLLF